MEAKGRPLRFLCDEQVLEIPFFQRAYVWNKDNWEDLLEDLKKGNGSHFLGSIILKRTITVTGVANKAIVIDGQQRLTTLSILIKAMYDAIEKKNSRLINDAIDALFYTLRSSDDNYKLTISHSHCDSNQYAEVIGEVVNGEISSPVLYGLDEIDENNSRMLIKRCYKYFYTELKEMEQEKLKNLWDVLFDRNNNILVVIDLNESDQEQKIFDTINSAGIRLSSTDIIKNALFQRLIELNGNISAVSKYYDNCWKKTFESDDVTIGYWSSEKTIGRLVRQNSELLLQTVAIIKRFFDFDNNTIQQLPDLYKKKIQSYSEQDLKDLIEEITEYAGIYRTHIHQFDGRESFEYDNKDLDAVELRVSKILATNDITTFNPYIVFIFKQYSGQKDIIISKLREIERYVMGYLITHDSIKNFNKDCITFINDFSGNEIKNRLKDFTPEKLKEGISKYVSNKLGTVLLFWIELRRRTDPKYDTKILQYNYQLEHIMPQSWETYWSSVDFVDENGNVLVNDESSKQARISKIYSLGNMTLLNGKLNASISNNSFETKVNGDGRKKGIKAYSSLSITKDDVIENVYEKNLQWNEKTIIEREKKLGKEVVSLWC